MAHKYGGPWSEVKLDAVEYYLQCYSNALTPKGMDIWYIDAYAGSGDREAERTIGGLMEGAPVEKIIETLDGSARRALKITPPYRHFIFIEMDAERAGSLQAIKLEYPSLDIRIMQGDANAELLKLCREEPWIRKAKSHSRAVVFLDPFAMQVDWTTVCALAETECVDVWYFFNVSIVTRNLAHDLDSVGSKAVTLDRVVSPRWRELYEIQPESEPSYQPDMFDLGAPPPTPSAKRTIAKHQVDKWFKGLLAEKFAFVSEPLPILTPHSGHTFSLFLAVANKHNKATELAEKFVRYVNKNFGPKAASRHKSDR